MRTVYEAANAVEAHMLVDLLKQEGITAVIHGAHLQGAVGELPAGGLVRVVVDEGDFEAARKVVMRWEATEPEAARPPRPVKSGRGVLGLLAGLAIGVVGTTLFFRTPVTSDGIDHNADGRLDEHWHFAASGRQARTDIDGNFDGTIDLVITFDERGVQQSSVADENFDGVFETKSIYRAGALLMTEVDTDGDGLANLRHNFRHGVLATTETLNPYSGLPLRVEHFKLGVLQHADADTDKDGRLDTRVTYGPLKDVLSTEKISP